jgi:hypothetical protein
LVFLTVVVTGAVVLDFTEETVEDSSSSFRLAPTRLLSLSSTSSHGRFALCSTRSMPLNHTPSFLGRALAAGAESAALTRDWHPREWAAVPGRLLEDLTADRLGPLAEVTEQFRNLFLFAEEDRGA